MAACRSSWSRDSRDGFVQVPSICLSARPGQPPVPGARSAPQPCEFLLFGNKGAWFSSQRCSGFKTKARGPASRGLGRAVRSRLPGVCCHLPASPARYGALPALFSSFSPSFISLLLFFPPLFPLSSVPSLPFPLFSFILVSFFVFHYLFSFSLFPIPSPLFFSLLFPSTSFLFSSSLQDPQCSRRP